MVDGCKPGDIVMLMSGGPRMTVTDVRSMNGQLRAWCSWFLENGEEKQGVFPVDSLKRV